MEPIHCSRLTVSMHMEWTNRKSNPSAKPLSRAALGTTTASSTCSPNDAAIDSQCPCRLYEQFSRGTLLIASGESPAIAPDEGGQRSVGSFLKIRERRNFCSSLG